MKDTPPMANVIEIRPEDESEAHTSLDAICREGTHGKAKPRQATNGTGTRTIEAPRGRDRREGHHFTSATLPPYMRRTPKRRPKSSC